MGTKLFTIKRLHKIRWIASKVEILKAYSELSEATSTSSHAK